MTPTTRPPSTAPIIRPRPPNRLVPPMTAAATPNSTYWPPLKLLDIPARFEAQMIPLIPAVTPQSTKARIRIRLRLTPARLAASALPPIAYTYRPNLVRFSRTVQATSRTRMTRTTQGTPLTTENPTPRLVLPIRTTTTPAIAITATFRMVTLTGG